MKSTETWFSHVGILKVLMSIFLFNLAYFQADAASEHRFEKALKSEFSDARLKRMLHPGLHLNLAEEIYKWDPNKGFIRKEVFRNYIKDLEEFRKCLDALNVARGHLSKMPKDKWILIVDDFHRDLANRLSSLKVSQKWKFFRFNQALSIQENIADTPEGEILVSDQDGMLSLTELSADYITRRFPWGKYRYGLSLDVHKYLDQRLNGRDLLRAKFYLSGNYKSTLAKVDSYEVGLAFAGDIFETNGKNEWTVTHIIPSLSVIYKPIKTSNIFFKGLSTESFLEIDSRSYQGDNQVNSFNESKDTIAIKALQRFEFSRLAHLDDSDLFLSFGLLSQNSDAEEFNYVSVLLDLSYVKDIKTFDVGPYLKIKTRTGMDYLQTQSRDDWYNRFGVIIDKTIRKDHIKLRLDVSRENNHSDVSFFDYDNHKIVLEAECRW